MAKYTKNVDSILYSRRVNFRMGNIGTFSIGRCGLGTPPGTFFAVIGLSLGFNDPASAQYIGLGLHILTGTVAGNIFGQIALFWRKLIPYNVNRGVYLGLIVGVTLWAVLFLPLTIFGIMPSLDEFIASAPNSYVNNIANYFTGLYPVIIGGCYYSILYMEQSSD